VIYLAGYFDGFDQALLEGLTRENAKEREASERENLPRHVSVGDAVGALDRFYLDPENLNIPIWQAIRITALKFASRPELEVEAEMEKARAGVRYDLEQCEKKKLGCEHLR
jgi:hypothetical protein